MHHHHYYSSSSVQSLLFLENNDLDLANFIVTATTTTISVQFLLSLENNDINLVVTTTITITTITVQSLQFLEKYKSRTVININRAAQFLYIVISLKVYKIDAQATLSQLLMGSNSLKISEFLRLV